MSKRTVPVREVVSDFTITNQGVPGPGPKARTFREPAKPTGTAPTRVRKFNVTLGSKGNHPHRQFNSGTQCLYINGKVGPTVHLQRGQEVVFQVHDLGAHSFYLTECPQPLVEGKMAPPIVGGFSPLSNGNARVRIGAEAPRVLYYHCGNHPYEGGLVLVDD